MTELRVEMEPDDLEVIDAEAAATGSDRKKIVTRLIREYNHKKRAEITLMCRVLQINPTTPERRRNGGGND